MGHRLHIIGNRVEIDGQLVAAINTASYGRYHELLVDMLDAGETAMNEQDAEDEPLSDALEGIADALKHISFKNYTSRDDVDRAMGWVANHLLPGTHGESVTSEMLRIIEEAADMFDGIQGIDDGAVSDLSPEQAAKKLPAVQAMLMVAQETVTDFSKRLNEATKLAEANEKERKALLSDLGQTRGILNRRDKTVITLTAELEALRTAPPVTVEVTTPAEPKAPETGGNLSFEAAATRLYIHLQTKQGLDPATKKLVSAVTATL